MARAESVLEYYRERMRLIKSRLRRCSAHPINQLVMFFILTDMWSSLRDRYFHSLVDTMLKSVQSVRSRKVGSTKY